MFKLRRTGQCVAALLAVVWLVSLIAYVGIIDEPHPEVQKPVEAPPAFIKEREIVVPVRGDRTRSRLPQPEHVQPGQKIEKPEVVADGDKVPVPIQMKEEQLSLQQIPEVDLN